MPKASWETASASVEGVAFQGHYENFEGGFTVGFETFSEQVDLTPRLKGLPDDRCQSAHWGYVIKGKLTYKFADRDDVVETGEAFYVPAGHTLLAEAGTEMVFFSPSGEWQETVEKIAEVAAIGAVA